MKTHLVKMPSKEKNFVSAGGQNQNPKISKDMILNALTKSLFPNGDPTFFTATHELNQTMKDELAHPYANSVWIYSAIQAITTPLIQMVKVLDDIDDTTENDVIRQNPILELLNNPNPLMDGATFWENILLDLLLPTENTKGGQCFIVAESGNGKPVNLRKGDVPAELFPFSDSNFTPIVSKEDNMLMGWKFQPANTQKVILYKPEEIIRLYLVDPEHPLRGQAPIWAGRQSLRQDKRASALNENFFANNASLGGTLQTDAELEDDVAKELRESFDEAYAGQDKAGRTALLHSGVRYERFQQTHQDMQFLEQKKYTREEILALYRVPKFAVSLYEDLNFATANTAVRTFWTNTLLPFDERLLRGFNEQWIKNTNNGNLKLKSDLTKVLALQPDLTDKLKQAQLMAGMHIPLTEINRRLELQLELDDIPWAKTSLVPFSLAPAEDVVEGRPDDTSTDDTSTDDDTNMEDTSASTVTNSLIANITKIAKASAREEKLRKEYISKVLVPDEKQFLKIVSTYLTTQRNQMLDSVDAWASSNKTNIKISENDKPSEDEFTKNKKAEDKRLQKKTKPEYERQAKNEAEFVNVELEGEILWNVTSPTMKVIIERRLKQITSINTTTFKAANKQIQNAVEQAVEDGLSRSATAKLIKKEINKVYQGRVNSVTIARTETASIHSQTKMDIYKANNISEVKWITASDELVRSATDNRPFPHDVLNSTTAKVSEGFNNGESIMYPLDPNSSPANKINCRCTMIAVK